MADYLTTREAAELVGLAEKYVRDLAREGRIVAILKGRHYWIDKDSILAYVQEMRALGSQKFNWRREDED
jgi:excisionase family DNA binding protein